MSFDWQITSFECLNQSKNVASAMTFHLQWGEIIYEAVVFARNNYVLYIVDNYYYL